MKKKSREFPLGGPSTCGKTGLAPCRQSTFSSCFVCSPCFSQLFFLTKSYKNRPPKITSQSVSAQQLLPHRLKNLNPSYQSYPKKMFKKQWELQSSAHKRLVSWKSGTTPKMRWKKSREFPLGGPSTCGKTGLAPCRQSTFSSCLICSPFFLMCFFWTKSYKNKPAKITSQSVSAQQLLPHRLKNLNPSYQSYPKKKCWKNNGSCKVRLINVLFLENLEQLQKCDEK